MNEMQVFKYKDNEVRTVEQGGEVWWVLKDVCRVLGISKHRDTASRLDEDERGSVKVDTPGGPQNMTIINESGLYKVILRSDKLEAKKFTRWVTHEVLPSIRRTGGYSAAGTQTFTVEQITQFAAAVVTQVVTQMAQTTTPASDPQVPEDRSEQKQRVRRRGALSSIERMAPELRREIEEMLCDKRCTYMDIVARLEEDGIFISPSSICRYAQRNNLFPTYEDEA